MASLTSFYLLLKFIHLAAVIIWIGGISAMTIMILRAGRETEARMLRATMQQVLFYGQRVVGPASGIVLLAGIAMVLNAKIPFSTPWVVWGMAGIVLHIVMGVTILRKNGERLVRLAGSATPDPEALAAALKRQRALASLYLVIMFSVVWAMVTKPTF